jgi:hypothetical protein
LRGADRKPLLVFVYNPIPARYTAADMPAAKTTRKKSAKTMTKQTKPAAPKKTSQKVADQKGAKQASSKTSTPKDKPDFAAIFSALRGMLESFQPEIATQTDKPGDYHTEIPGLFHRKKPLYFAGIRTGKNYVSYHLLPVYYNPDLNKRISPELKKRKQGMACFNFTSVDDARFAELSKLTALGLKMFKTAEFRRRLENMQ